MKKALINKADIAELVQFSENVNDRDIDMHIRDARMFDLEPLIPDALLVDIDTELQETVTVYDPETTYTTGTKVKHGGYYYKAILETTGNQPAEIGEDSDYWEASELMALYVDYIRPLMVYMTMARFMLTHGRKITPAGMRTIEDDTSKEITDKGRAELMADMGSKSNAYRMKLSKALNSANYKIGGKNYQTDDFERPIIGSKVKIFGTGEHRFSRRLINKQDKWRFQ